MEESSEFAPLLAIARQQALASRYEDAVASYVKVLKQIKHAIRSLGDSERAAEWLKVSVHDSSQNRRDQQNVFTHCVRTRLSR